jgi:hypothetical protein
MPPVEPVNPNAFAHDAWTVLGVEKTNIEKITSTEKKIFLITLYLLKFKRLTILSPSISSFKMDRIYNIKIKLRKYLNI